MDFQDIAGNEIAKRACEIALVGVVPVEFIGVREASDLLSALYSANSTIGQISRVVWPCPCKNLGDPDKTCTCTPEELKIHKRDTMIDFPAITVYATRATPEKIIQHIQKKDKLETTADILKRVELAKKQPIPTKINEAVWPFYTQVIHKVIHNQREAEFVLAIAKSISRLAGSDTVRIEHVAEAVQYRRKNI